MTSPIKPGDVLYDTIGGVQVTMVELTADGFVVEQQIEPDHPATLLNHLHMTWTETFEIVSGRGRTNVGGTEHAAEAGHVFTVQPRQTHIHPWNTGTEPLRFRQRSVFAPADPTAAVDTFLGFSTLFGLAREGKSNATGIPHNPLQLMVILEFFRQHGGYLAGLPVGVQNVIMVGGATFGRVLGYRPWYERFLP